MFMKRIALAMCLAAVALPLAGCSSIRSPRVAPSDIADTTTIDEQAAITAETAYTAASLLGARLAQAGLIDKAKFQSLDQKAYQAVLAERAAYAAGNADGFAAAVTQINAAVLDIRALAKGSN